MNFLRNLLLRYPILKNWYFLSAAVFLVWVTFFDRNSLISQYSDRSALYELRKEKKYYQEEIASSREQLRELLTDNRSLEKFAREKHLMKKDNEDIWLVIDEPPAKKEK